MAKSVGAIGALRRSQELARALYTIRTYVCALTWLAVGALICAIAMVLLNSPRTEVTRFVVEGGSSETVTAARKVMGDSIGHNIIRAPVAQYRKTILLDSLLTDATVRRSGLHTLTVTLTDRAPYFGATRKGRGYLVDARLVPYRNVSEFPRTIPVLEVSPSTPPQLGKPWENRFVLGAEKALREARKAGFKVRDLSIDRGGYICLNVEDSVQIRLGSPQDIGLKLKVASDFLESRAATAGTIDYVDVSCPGAPAFSPKKALARASNAN